MTIEKTYSEFRTKDILIRYIQNTSTSVIGLRIIPISMENKILKHRADISDQKEAWIFRQLGGFPSSMVVEPLVQLCCAEDDRAGGFSQGISMHNSSSVTSQVFLDQRIIQNGVLTTVETDFETSRQIKITHCLQFSDSASYLTIWSSVTNSSKTDIQLQMLSSFTLGGITPFHSADAPERLFLHRFRSSWSSEGRHCAESIEDLGLEPSWSTHGVRCERFGQIGSMPVRGWYPVTAVEDRDSAVFWGVQLEAPSSWQLEAFRKDDYLNLSGGLADMEFGHWSKTLKPGDSFSSPIAAMTTVQGTLDDVCSRLLELQQPETEDIPENEKNCPVIFNEWCTSWGRPEADKILTFLPLLHDIGVGYYVIDAGWYEGTSGSWETSHGDWNVSKKLFPEGFEKITKRIKQYGMIPGLWYEFETAGKDSDFFKKIEFLLKKDGVAIRSGDRHFLDFRNKQVRDYLNKKVTSLLKSQGFGYLKIDYNETTGIGCDGEQSPAEELRTHINKVQNFIRDIRKEIPGIVIENCSSGGHRQEPSFINITDMTSFSDAHETVNIPIIAANLNRLVLQRKCQIWVVLHPDDSRQRMYYSLSSVFLGRMCLSGEIDKLNQQQIQLAAEAVSFYNKAAEIIDSRKITRSGPEVKSYRHPAGWQAILKTDEEIKTGFIVFHSFENSPESLNIKLPIGTSWQIKEIFGNPDLSVQIHESSCQISGAPDFTGAVIFIEKAGTKEGVRNA